MNAFYRLLGIALLVTTTNNFVWFALTFWAYLTTQSVISTSIVGGGFLVATALSSIWFGSIVDHHKKKHAMLGSSFASLGLFALGLVVLVSNPEGAFASVTYVTFWLFAALLLAGTVSGSIYAIAIPTLVAVLVPADRRDKANGMFGTVMGVSFALTSVASGLVLGYAGMVWVLLAAIVCTLSAIGALSLVSIPENKPLHTGTAQEQAQPGHKLDLAGTIAVVRSVPGLYALIFFTTFNNLLGGVFMALMDAYGLTLVSVQTWGLLWGVLSLGFIAGGLVISRRGLGATPLRNLFRFNLIVWTVCVFFTIQASVVLLAIGTLIWIFFMPFIEATEQTVFQKVVPPDRLGRVFGFAHAVEQSASPLTAFFIGPLAQWVFIPFMTTGAGVELIGGWFGTGPGRGIALVFSLAGMVGLTITMIAMRSRQYQLLSAHYAGTAQGLHRRQPRLAEVRIEADDLGTG